MGFYMKVNRKQLSVESLHGDHEQADKLYWHGRTPMERLRAVQINRQVAYGQTNIAERLQRVLEIAERS